MEDRLDSFVEAFRASSQSVPNPMEEEEENSPLLRRGKFLLNQETSCAAAQSPVLKNL